jgi:two-component system LytT family response regulator
MTILIIEDERPASERIIAMVREFDPQIRIADVLPSVKDSLMWLASHPAPDCIVADIQLNDGLSLEIFRKHPVSAPIIFTTAYDEYLLKAFAFNSIDYLLKPIDKTKLFRALQKYLALQEHFTMNIAALSDQLRLRPPMNDRIIVKKGTDFIAVKREQIAYFSSEHKITFLLDVNGVRYIVDQPLAELEETFTGPDFFRINRKYLAGIQSVVRFRPFEKGKLLVELKPSPAGEVIVSQENGAAFKLWVGKR